MPSVDELLNAVEVAVTGTTETNDVIEIDADTRTMIIPETERIFGVVSDEKGERKYFRCKRFVGNGIDLSKLDLRVIYQNASGFETGRDKYIVTDLATDGEDYVAFSWELSRKVTAYKGIISFIVCAIKTGMDGIITNEWNTTLANGVVLDGLEVSGTQEQEEEAYDYYKQLEAELLRVANEQKAELENTVITTTNDLFSTSGLLNDLSKKIEFFDGEYIDMNGSVNKLSGYSRSKPIMIDAGAEIRFLAQGYEKNVAMISKLVGDKWIPVVVSRSSDKELYKYVAVDKSQYAFSCVTNSMDMLVSVLSIEASASKVVAENNVEHGIESSLEIKWNGGKFVANSGVVVELDGYGISDIISLPPNVKLTFYGQGYEKNVSMISRYNGVKYIPLVVSRSNNFEEYSYVTEEQMEIVVSSGSFNKSVLKYSMNVFETINSIYSEADKMLENVSLSLFYKFGVVGDSFASGEICDELGTLRDIYSVSWGKILARKLGTQCVNYSEGGLTTRTWLKSSKGLSLLNSTEPQSIYYLALGINDIYTGGINYLGVISDIEKKADTFYGNYGKIINAIKIRAPKAKMIMFTTAFSGEVESMYNDAIINIAKHFRIPYIIQLDDEYFNSKFYISNIVSSHPIAINYSGMANAFERLIKKCVMDNIDYFKFMYAHD